jgi:hypothetical protein
VRETGQDNRVRVRKLKVTLENDRGPDVLTAGGGI